MYEVPDPIIDVEMLIKEVKARPCLYKKGEEDSYDEYVELKNKAWDEITALIYKRLWDSYSDEEKAEKCK